MKIIITKRFDLYLDETTSAFPYRYTPFIEKIVHLAQKKMSPGRCLSIQKISGANAIGVVVISNSNEGLERIALDYLSKQVLQPTKYSCYQGDRFVIMLPELTVHDSV